MIHRLCRLLLAGWVGTGALWAAGSPVPPLEDPEPFWPGLHHARLATPQWIGEPGIEAVVILSIDDLRDPAKYEAFTRPIIGRLKALSSDGRAAFSMMANQVPADSVTISRWLGEGVALETHTLTHPCPLLNSKGLDVARQDFFGCVDLMFSIPGNAPAAFRMPCCDSQNSGSPRFFAEILPKTSRAGTFVRADSSVLNVFTKNDAALPKEVVTDAAGRDRFLKYFPSELIPGRQLKIDRLGALVENYPYPYAIGSTWEFPIAAPTDWQAWNFHVKREAPEMLEDWRAALDATVVKQGVMTLCFHGHGWCSAAQIVALIDHAEQKHSGRVRFLTFRDAVARLEKNLLNGAPLRQQNGTASGSRILDLNGDGFMDAVSAQTRHWDAKSARWLESPTPFELIGAKFGRVHPSLVSAFSGSKLWTFRDGQWKADARLERGLPVTGEASLTSTQPGVRFRDFDRDGSDELLASNPGRSEVWRWSEANGEWKKAPYQLDGVALATADGDDNGLRFVDLNGDGFDDIFQSNDQGVVIALWAKSVQPHLGWNAGWSQIVKRAERTGPAAAALPPPIAIKGANNGFWTNAGRAFWANEATEKEPCAAKLIPFRDLIAFEVPLAKSPEESLASFQVRPGFRAELVACEPAVVDPVAFEWDAAGRLWVVEMRDYPMGIDGKGKPGGVVKRLEDRDGDGRQERATVFLEGLRFPTGVLPWRDGVLIAAAPEIIFARDTSGDGVCDEKKVLFTGFVEGNQQHRMNGFELGLDGWVYGANGDSGGNVKCVATAGGAAPPAGKSVNIRGRDFRFQPDTGRFETISGVSQYGLRRDDWGRWFGNNNPNWLWHVSLPEHYLRRNPKLAVSSVTEMLAQHAQGNRVFAASAPVPRFNQPESLGRVTSACSPAPYRDDLFGADFAASVFICEPVHNVVHREVLRDDGFQLSSDRAEGEKDTEFLASRDPWFRPVMTKTGPDGALYIADMVRFVLEHPEWISPEDQARLDLRAGADKGRLWRVRPDNATLKPPPNLAALDAMGLAGAMDSANGWQRDTVLRLLGERSDAAAAVPVLEKLAKDSTHPKARVQALAALDLLGATTAGIVGAALRDTHPQVRMQALRSCEKLAEAHPEILTAAAALEMDPSPQVRRQLAFSLGSFTGLVKMQTLTQLAARDGQNEAMRLAVLTSVAPDSPFLAQLQGGGGKGAQPVSLPKLDAAPNPDRARVAARYLEALPGLQGDARRGAEKFAANCAVCHRMKNTGNPVGPDLAMVAAKPSDWLCTAIFDPNAAVEARYATWIAKRKNGELTAGIIAAETANNLVLRTAAGAEISVLRTELQDIAPLGKSLMPEGLEAALSPQDLADLLAWMKQP